MSSALLLLKILVRDQRMTVVLINNTTLSKNVIACIPAEESVATDCEFINNCLACLYNLVYINKELCEYFDEPVIQRLVRYALRDERAFKARWEVSECC